MTISLPNSPFNNIRLLYSCISITEEAAVHIVSSAESVVDTLHNMFLNYPKNSVHAVVLNRTIKIYSFIKPPLKF